MRTEADQSTDSLPTINLLPTAPGDDDDDDELLTRKEPGGAPSVYLEYLRDP